MSDRLTVTRFAEKNGELVPVTDEIASVLKDDLFRGFIGTRLLNPDQVLATESKGQGLQFYDILERDCHVGGVLQQRKLAVIGKEWEILPASEASRDQEIATFVEQVFKELGTALRTDAAMAPKSGFDAARQDLLDGILKGFSVAEILWRVRSDGAVVIDELKGRNPRRFVFDVENRLRLLTLQSPIEGELLPPRKFAVLIFQKKYDDPYGVGLGQKLWWPVWFKKHGIKFWVTFADKFGMPTAIGKYPSGAKPEQQAALLNALKAIQQETAVKIPVEMEIGLLEAQRQGSLNTYGDLIRFMNDEISKAVLGQTLTTEIGKTGGAYAASKTHDEVRLEIVKADADALSEVLNNQVIPPLVQFNFPGITAYPKCWHRCEEEEDLTALSERDERLTKNIGLPVGKKYFYDTYGIPEPASGEELVAPPAPSHPFDASAGRADPGAGSGSNAGARFAESGDPEQQAVQGTLALDRLAQAAVAKAVPLYRRAVEQIVTEIRSVPTLEAAVHRFSEGSHILIPGLADLVHRVLVTAELAGRATFFEQAQAQAARGLRFAETDIPDGFDFDPLPAEEALRFFRKKVPISDSAFRAMNAKMKQLAFRIAGVEDEALVSAVRDKIEAGLRGELTLGQFLREAPALFEAAGVTARSPHHLETMFRTNTLTALNAGKWEEAHDPDVQELFPLYRYSAILDDRTRPEHEQMHGFTAPITDPVWATWWPPNGFNCRCTVVPLSSVYVERNQIRASRRPPGGIQPDPGFRSNPGASLENWANG